MLSRGANASTISTTSVACRIRYIYAHEDSPGFSSTFVCVDTDIRVYDCEELLMAQLVITAIERYLHGMRCHKEPRTGLFRMSPLSGMGRFNHSSEGQKQNGRINLISLLDCTYSLDISMICI